MKTQQLSQKSILTVVGVGASAGGLSAFSELLHHLPTDTGMAFVLIQHLDPQQTNLLTELLGQTTQIPVQTVENGMVVEANQVYVIPPNAQMTLTEGQLHLAVCDEAQQRSKTIDLFLQSLADHQQNQAIAIILSGSNNDGAEGVAAVRAAGGITFAQSPATAEFPEMPNAAIATGQVDFVLPPAEITEELLKISRQPYLREAPVEEQGDNEPAIFQGGELLTIFRLLQKSMGVDFASYKPTTFQRRLRRRMALHKLPALADYIQYLQETPPEIQALYQDVLITVTSFFRDPEIYAVLQETVFPALLQQQSATSSIRIWVPGCSTGEEAYSIAICLLECLNSMLISPTIQIFGTDISDAAIEEARLGIYRQNRMEGVSPERQRRFFTEVDSGYQINKSVRELCVFARQDLSSDPPFSDMDLVSCRNVLIYFKPPLQRRVLSIFHYSLKGNGFLVLGNSESVGDTSELFEVHNSPAKVYTRRAVPTRLNLDFVTSQHYPQEMIAEQRRGFPASLNQSNVRQWADQIVLNRYAPVGVIINDHLEILQFRGETSSYLRPPVGEPSFNLLKMIRPSLLIDVRSAIEAAKAQNVAINCQQLQLEDPPTAEVSLEVIPFNVTTSQERCFLVLFERTSLDATVPRGDRGSEAPKEPTTSDAETNRLQQDLATARQELLDTQTFLRLTIEEQESTHQRLIAANEEILSSNEELKSTNEELQTAKEEIQSANEELRTTNEELQSRNAEARRANDDLINLINNVNIPILMLSNDLCIRRFTPMMRSLFNLIPSDVGRPISDIRFEIDIPNLETLIAEVFDTLNTVEQEVQDREGCWYLLRVRPYRTVANQIDGVVIVLVDIDNLKRTEQSLRNSQAQLKTELFTMNQVQSLSRQLFTSFDLNQALNEVLHVALTIHHTQMGCVHLYNSEHNILEMVAQKGFEPSVRNTLQVALPNGGSPYSRVLTSGRQVIVEDIEADPDYVLHRQTAATVGFRAVQSTPLVNRAGDLLGVLSTHFTTPYSPSERELRMLELYARQASEFIDLMRAQQERQGLLEREQAAHLANVRKDEFLSVLSHELRTPLNGILGWTQLMESGGLDESGMNEAIALVKTSALIQSQLVEDLLDASRMIQGRFQINPQSTDLADLLMQAIALMQPQIEAKGLQLEVELTSGLERLAVDPERMAQVFGNLLSNAIKFTPSGEHITVRLTDSPSQVQVQVQDTGQGIAPDMLPHIFDRFSQGDASITRREAGLGLGLFLVHSIVEAHEGTVEAASLGVGQGATFTITLPKMATAEVIQPSALTTPTTENFLDGIRILVVDDDAISLHLLQVFLENLGATVLTASFAAEALTIITRESLDLLVSDIGLPEVNGYELMRQVRALPAEQGGQLPAIALTGYASSQDIQAATEAGFQRHLAKPVINFNDLAATIYQLIRV
ncbi:MAG: chemotaxis protein CheB [Cyanobacteria bacterium J06638_28]